MVTDNKQVELAAQYLKKKKKKIFDEEICKMEYEWVKKQRNQSVPPNRHWTIIERIKEEKQQKLNLQKKSGNELLLEIYKLKGTLNSIKKKRIDLKKKRDEIDKSFRLTLYKEYIRGIVAEPKIHPSELAHMERYKNHRRINEEDHINTLKVIGYTSDTFDKLKTDKDIMEEEECLVCYDPPRDHMIIPCNCICLCPECAEENFPSPHDGQRCPSCSKNILRIEQIFFH
eukprot:440847_1